MIVEIAEFRVRTGAGPQFEQAFADVRQRLLDAQGCRDAQLWPSVDLADTYLLQVRWDRLEDHIEVFAGTETAAELVATLGPHCDEPPRVVHYEAPTR
ncbi:antibiotic biosynthesis monooxygenase family protein [Blastococcus sp. SYSU D00820]